MHSNGNKSGVNVVVRIRPSTTRDFSNPYYATNLMNQNNRTVIHTDPQTNDIVHIDYNNEMKTYTFDHVAGQSTTQDNMFDSCGKPIVESCLDGYNGTIFCYGQTGAGKTYCICCYFQFHTMELTHSYVDIQ
jgi:hypothetical protein